MHQVDPRKELRINVANAEESSWYVDRAVLSASDLTNAPLQIGGPLWYGPLHDPAFVEQMLVHVDEHRENIATGTRMHGMLNVAKAVSFIWKDNVPLR